MRIEAMLRRSAAARGACPAVISARARHSYAELDLKADRLSAALRAGGVGRGGRVLVFMDGGWEAVVSIFAVFKAGGVLVPVDAEATAASLAEMLGTLAPVAVITQSRLATMVAAAIASAASVRLVVLSGGDPTRSGGTCISFEQVVGRITRLPVLPASDVADEPAVLMTGSSPLTHRQLLDEARRVDVSDDAIALASVAGGDGLARLVAAIGAGRAVVARSRFPREEEAGRISAPAPRETARFDFSGLLHSIAGEEPALQR